MNSTLEIEQTTFFRALIRGYGKKKYKNEYDIRLFIQIVEKNK